MSVEPQGLFARLYLDEDMHKLVAEAMRLRGFDVVSVFEAGLCGLDDSEQLAHAATEHRAIVTYSSLVSITKTVRFAPPALGGLPGLALPRSPRDARAVSRAEELRSKPGVAPGANIP